MIYLFILKMNNTKDIYYKDINNLISKIKEDYIYDNINDLTHENIKEC